MNRLSKVPKTAEELDALMRRIFGDEKWERHQANKAAHKARLTARLGQDEKGRTNEG